MFEDPKGANKMNVTVTPDSVVESCLLPKMYPTVTGSAPFSKPINSVSDQLNPILFIPGPGPDQVTPTQPKNPNAYRSKNKGRMLPLAEIPKSQQVTGFKRKIISTSTSTETMGKRQFAICSKSDAVDLHEFSASDGWVANSE